MATITDKRSINATLSTTTVDRAQLLQFWDYIEVYNGEASGGDDLYITDDGATDPVAAAEGTRRVAPGERLMFSSRPLTNSIPDGSAVICHEIRVLGNGGSYSIEGHSTVDAATTSVRGTVPLATTAASAAMTDATSAVTPAGLAAALRHARIKDGSTPLWTLPGMIPTQGTTSTGANGPNVDYFGPFFVTAPLILDQLGIDISSGGAGSTARIGIVALDENMQGTGAVITESGAIDTSAGGVKTYTPGSPVTLSPGWYATVYNCSATAPVIRFSRWAAPGGAFAATLGATRHAEFLYKSRTFAAFGSPTWDTIAFGSTGGFVQHVMLRVSDPSA